MSVYIYKYSLLVYIYIIYIIYIQQTWMYRRKYVFQYGGLICLSNQMSICPLVSLSYIYIIYINSGVIVCVCRFPVVLSICFQKVCIWQNEIRMLHFMDT